jgi:predicted ribosome quality control (RQC) complex YloA/Tae2 family protein
VHAITAPHDERVVIIELGGERKQNATYRVIIELLTNQWNAVALDHAGKVLRVLKPRATGRVFKRGQIYQPPTQPERERVPFRSPFNAAVADDAWQQIVANPPAPSLIETPNGWQPYPHHLHQPNARRFDSLLAACAALGGEESIDAIVKELARQLAHTAKKIDRLRAELLKAEAEAAQTRERADVLLAYATTVTRGVSRVILPGFSGGDVDIELDPKLSAMDNAKRLYDEARKQARALKRLPSLVAETQRQQDRLKSLLERARRGELSAIDLQEIGDKPAIKPQTPGTRLPYRRYRTSNGLEVRVGRNAKSNDELTLHHSSPRDIWMHARHVGGAHVVLRWQDAETNPPARDIAEAAALAAIHSAARTSRMVPVDYTRRKHVRKPRRSPPGTVMVERAKTVFVEPDAELEEMMRW